MSFLANENIPLDSVHLLRRAGHHVLSISEKHAFMKDVDVLKRAVKDKSIILTLLVFLTNSFGFIAQAEELVLPAPGVRI